MKLLLLAIFSGMLFSSDIWGTDIEEAKNTAAVEHKFILLNFSGSDWCGPCIRLTKTIFEKDAFTQFAEKNLVLVNADFPRMKKNHLPQAQQDKNNKLAEKYNNNGIFPLTLLLNPKGEVMAQWEGLPDMSVDEFIKNIQFSIDAKK